MKIAQGAEAVLYREDEKLIKERIKKGYRIEELDQSIRKERTRREARLLSEARRAGIDTPTIIEVDERNFKIIMGFIDGKRLKELINSVTDEEKKKIAEKVGRAIGLLHSAGIVHGDLTTSNMIEKNSRVYFIDFGLGSFSKRIEDQAVDLSVLHEAIKSTHFKYLNMLWGYIIQGYKETNKDWERVLRSLDNIEMRGRYVRRRCD
ncbi:MAG: KEOPS complex kinase/ATPase Bud32 [Candidatus Aenigmatarchaeota archaeon]